MKQNRGHQGGGKRGGGGHKSYGHGGRGSGYKGSRGGGRGPGRGNPRRDAAHRDGAHRDKIYIYGKHALTEALANMPRVVKKVFLTGEAGADPELQELLRKAGIVPGILHAAYEADRMVGEETAHQGVIATINTDAMLIDFRTFAQEKFSQEWLRSAAAAKTMLVLLDELTDPHNVGAIIRSAAAFGAAGVLIPSHNQAPITGAVVKASAGMAFRVPLVSVGNVNQVVDELRRLGFRSYGLAMSGARVLGEETFDAPTVIIVGNEGAGIRQKTLERCDVTLKIPMDARAESLNASVSAAVVMYQWSLRHLG
jgi:23S rRNA (guanosine2251-2'-O)-methyltransferase